ncbi:hypothetical protein B0H13DRAFT_1876460 [Mycena leptocephala]|nr:hypothetical protein B0H13DRAFT_1876460 [Mycena leptocephala]
MECHSSAGSFKLERAAAERTAGRAPALFYGSQETRKKNELNGKGRRKHTPRKPYHVGGAEDEFQSAPEFGYLSLGSAASLIPHPVAAPVFAVVLPDLTQVFPGESIPGAPSSIPLSVSNLVCLVVDSLCVVGSNLLRHPSQASKPSVDLSWSAR